MNEKKTTPPKRNTESALADVIRYLEHAGKLMASAQLELGKMEHSKTVELTKIRNRSNKLLRYFREQYDRLGN